MALSRKQMMIFIALVLIALYMYTRRASSMGPSDMDQRVATDMKNMKVTQVNHIDNPVLGTVGAPF
jgi:hypothetical protein